MGILRQKEDDPGPEMVYFPYIDAGKRKISKDATGWIDRHAINVTYEWGDEGVIVFYTSDGTIPPREGASPSFKPIEMPRYRDYGREGRDADTT